MPENTLTTTTTTSTSTATSQRGQLKLNQMANYNDILILKTGKSITDNNGF